MFLFKWFLQEASLTCFLGEDSLFKEDTMGLGDISSKLKSNQFLQSILLGFYCKKIDMIYIVG